MDTAPKLTLYYTIYGLFEPEELSHISGMSPSYIWRKGGKKEYRINSYEEDDGWVFETPEISSFSLEDEVLKFIEMIEPKRELIVKFISKYNLHSELCIEICSEYSDESESSRNYPSIHFEKDLLTRIVSLGCEIDIDILY